MTFQKESDFEEALIKILTTKGWESTILKYPTEQDLIHASAAGRGFAQSGGKHSL